MKATIDDEVGRYKISSDYSGKNDLVNILHKLIVSVFVRVGMSSFSAKSPKSFPIPLVSICGRACTNPGLKL